MREKNVFVVDLSAKWGRFDDETTTNTFFRALYSLANFLSKLIYRTLTRQMIAYLYDVLRDSTRLKLSTSSVFLTMETLYFCHNISIFGCPDNFSIVWMSHCLEVVLLSHINPFSQCPYFTVFKQGRDEKKFFFGIFDKYR